MQVAINVNVFGTCGSTVRSFSSTVPPIATDLDEIRVVETMLDPARWYIVLNKLIAIISRETSF